jgi:hypothetical protein
MGAFFTKEEIKSKQEKIEFEKVSKEITGIMNKPYYKTVPVSVVRDGKKKKRIKRSLSKKKKSKN